VGGGGGKMRNDELLRRAGIAGAVDGEIGAGDAGAFGEVPELGGVKIGGGMSVDDFAAGFAVEMNVLVEVRAVAGLAALEVDLLDQPGGGEVVEAVVNRGQRDAGGAGLHAIEDVVGRGVVRGGGEHIENLAAVGCEAHIGTEDGHAALEAGGLRRDTGGGGRGCHDGSGFRIGMILKQVTRCLDPFSQCLSDSRRWGCFALGGPDVPVRPIFHPHTVAAEQIGELGGSR
jgi:hypothetical protein